jgi:hypothetical protein
MSRPIGNASMFRDAIMSLCVPRSRRVDSEGNVLPLHSSRGHSNAIVVEVEEIEASAPLAHNESRFFGVQRDRSRDFAGAGEQAGVHLPIAPAAPPRPRCHEQPIYRAGACRSRQRLIFLS